MPHGGAIVRDLMNQIEGLYPRAYGRPHPGWITTRTEEETIRTEEEITRLVAERDLLMTIRAQNVAKTCSGPDPTLLPPPSTQGQWAGSITAGSVPSQGMVAYRIWGGDALQPGQWLSPIPLSSAQARALLALPPSNSAAFISRVEIPGGTQLQYGPAAPLFGQPGGGMQIQLLEMIPRESFQPGIPLGQ